MNLQRIAVVGAGHMGRLHAGKVVALRDSGESVSLAGIADIDFGRAEKLGSEHSVPATRDFEELLPHCDALIVAVPTEQHFDVVRRVLAADRDVLVEKPIASSVKEAEELLALAKSRERILQVGHLEWFNAATRVIREHIQRPRFVEAHRMGPFSSRSADIDVVRDLMIHDIDILQQLLGEEPCGVEAVGVPVLTNTVDIANARLTYPSGCVANFTASRISPTPMRKLRFFQTDGYFSIDFLSPAAVVLRRSPASNGSSPQIHAERIDVGKGDALRAQLEAFVDSVRSRRPASLGWNGAGGGGPVGALRTALRIVAAMPAQDALE